MILLVRFKYLTVFLLLLSSCIVFFVYLHCFWKKYFPLNNFSLFHFFIQLARPNDTVTIH